MTNDEIKKRLEAIVSAELVLDEQKVGKITKQAFEAIQETARLAIAALERDRWISVEERLPTAERKHYWICTDTGYQCECRWTNNLFGFGESDNWGWSIFDIPQYQKVVAWRPLPDTYEQPKEDKKE